MTVIAQFTNAFKDGELKVTWADGYGNYGMPMPIIHHQLISYAGGLVNLVVNDVPLATGIVMLSATFLSCLFFYGFLRLYASPESSFLGAFIFNFTSYRIFNLYTRGALPEYLASIFLPLLLIGLYYFIHKRKSYAFFLIVLSIAGIILSHPFTLIVYSIIFLPYLTYLIYQQKQRVKLLLFTLLAFGLGIGLVSYYLVPLVIEIRYFYYGRSGNHFIPGQFLGLSNYFSPQWVYFYKDSPFVRGNIVPFGLIDSLLLIIGYVSVLYFGIKKNLRNNSLIVLFIGISIILVFFTTFLSEPFYRYVPLLANIQYPWRMLSGLFFIPPIITALLLDKCPFRFRIGLILFVIIIVSIFQFPQLYGKNVTIYPEGYYYKTIDNVAAVVLNPVWTAESQTYPVKSQKPEIIDGQGSIQSQSVTNSTRRYVINAQTDLRMVDYTFYFPGWKAYVDGKETVIEYQDPNYRGVITYFVPKGTHEVYLAFQESIVRIGANILSLVSLIIVLVCLVLVSKSKKIKKFLYE